MKNDFDCYVTLCAVITTHLSDRDFVSANGKVKDWDPGREAGVRCNVIEGVVGRKFEKRGGR